MSNVEFQDTTLNRNFISSRIQFVHRSLIYVRVVVSSAAISACVSYLETIVSKTVEGLRSYVIPVLVVSKRGYIVDFLS